MAVTSLMTALLVLWAASAATALPQGPPPPVKDGVKGACPEVSVGPGQPKKYIRVEDSLTLFVRPSQPTLLLGIMLGHRQLQVIVDGEMMQLQECHQMQQQQQHDHQMEQQDRWQQPTQGMCMPLDTWVPQKSHPQFLSANVSNTVTVTLVPNQVPQVKIEVGGASVGTTTDGAASATVWVLTPATQHCHHQPDLPGCGIYQAHVKLFCNATVIPQVETVPTTTPRPTTIPPSQFPNCPTYRVEQLSELTHISFTHNLTLAVLPSHPNLYFKVFYHDVVFKASVQGTSIKLQNCSLTKQPQECQVVDEGGTKSADILSTNSWNIVHISLDSGTVRVDVNMKKDVMAMVNPGEEGPEYVVVLPSDPAYEMYPRPTMYNVLVNIKCNDTTEHVTTPHPHHSTPAPRVDEKEEMSSVNVVGIVVGVLAIVLLALGIACGVSSYRNRRTAHINQHQQLQETQQQQ